MKKKNDRARPGGADRTTRGAVTPVGVRIIGGKFRGRKLEYSGDLRTRPMKDRLRESLFNRLGYSVKDRLAIDLFAGTGALGFEAMSRGAARAILIERHLPTSRALRRSAEMLGIGPQVEVVAADTFLWFRRGPELGILPRAVFCSPPYDFYVDRLAEMLELVEGLYRTAADGSPFVVEADERFDFGLLPEAERWDVRSMLPAVVGIRWKGE